MKFEIKTDLTTNNEFSYSCLVSTECDERKFDVMVFQSVEFGTQAWKPAQVNWSAYGSCSLNQAQAYAALLTKAVKLATARNKLVLTPKL